MKVPNIFLVFYAYTYLHFIYFVIWIRKNHKNLEINISNERTFVGVV